jgi:hypothetical protein
MVPQFLVSFFDIGSRLTSFLFFNWFGYLFTMGLVFAIPLYSSIEFIDFLILITRNPKQILLFFNNLPIALQLLFLFYIFFFEVVFLCTFWSTIPISKEQMIKKENDSLILKKRHSTMWSSTLRRSAALSVSAVAAIVISGDCFQHHTTRTALSEKNGKVWEEFRRTNNLKLLDKLQKVPTGGYSERLREVTVGFVDSVMSWKSGSKTRDYKNCEKNKVFLKNVFQQSERTSFFMIWLKNTFNLGFKGVTKSEIMEIFLKEWSLLKKTMLNKKTRSFSIRKHLKQESRPKTRKTRRISSRLIIEKTWELFEW